MNRLDPLPFAANRGRLIVHCLGRFRACDASGRELAIRTRKARALLAYIASSERPVSRHHLTALLWSDRGEEQARASFRQTLFELRKLHPLETHIDSRRDTICVDVAGVTTDLQVLCEEAAVASADRLATRLAGVEMPFLADLDGLDPEFDTWLRVQRAQVQEQVTACALRALQRLRDQGSTARECLPILGEIARIDPANEQAARAAMQLDAEAGDSASLHRRYQQLRDRLSEEYDAEPSAETAELFANLVGGLRTRMQARQGAAVGIAGIGPRIPSRRNTALFGLVLLVVGLVAAALWNSWRHPTAEPVVLAVLPFEQQPADGSFLAEGLWEHTRAAISRNPSLRILGRATTTAMSERDLSPQEYARRLGVTHLLEGIVRRNGDQVIVSVNLSRTSDGVGIWHELFRGKIDEPLGLQDAIASGIEGKLRGRLAGGGGRRAEQITTTPEVYALYSEARRLIASRQLPNLGRAEALLRRAVATDANYAPAWSLLGASIYFNARGPIVDSAALAEASSAVRKALTLAPNLAQAHATLAMLEGEASPTAERSLRTAVTLDPGYAEAWNWLGNALNAQYRHREAVAAYQRAVAIDPLLAPAIANLAQSADEIGDSNASARLIDQVRKAGGDPLLIAYLQSVRHLHSGDYSTAMAMLERTGLDGQGHAPGILWSNWFAALTALGQFERLHAVTQCPDWYAGLLQSQRLPPKHHDGRAVRPQEFWTSIYFSTPASRAMVNLGEADDLIAYYRAGYPNADDFISATSKLSLLRELAPNLAVALRQQGRADEASYILSAAAHPLERGVRQARPSRYVIAELALIRAAQREKSEALQLLAAAVSRGWLPDGRAQALDLAHEPAWKPFAGDPRFERLRRRILAHIARERAELGTTLS